MNLKYTILKTILNEGRLEDVIKKYTGRVQKEAIQVFSDADPSGNNKYLDWMVKNYELVTKDYNETIDVIKCFHENVNRLSDNHVKAIFNDNDFKDLTSEQKNALEKIKKTPKDINSYPTHLWVKHVCTYFQELKPVTADRVKIWDNDRWSLVSPLTHEASCKYGVHSNWCVSTSNNRYYVNYTKTGVLIFWLDKKESHPKRGDVVGNYKIAVHIPFEHSEDPTAWRWYSMEDNELEATFMLTILPKDGIEASKKYVNSILSHRVKATSEYFKDMEEHILGISFRGQNIAYVFPKTVDGKISESTINHFNSISRTGFRNKIGDQLNEASSQKRVPYIYFEFSDMEDGVPYSTVYTIRDDYATNLKNAKGIIKKSDLINQLNEEYFFNGLTDDVKKSVLDDFIQLFNDKKISQVSSVPSNELSVGDVIRFRERGGRYRYNQYDDVTVVKVTDKSLVLSNGKRIIKSNTNSRDKIFKDIKIVDDTVNESFFKGDLKLIKTILNEGRLEDAIKKYQPVLNAEIVKELSAADPSGNNKYLDWMSNIVAVDQNYKDDVINTIKCFHENVNRLSDNHVKAIFGDDKFPTANADEKAVLERIRRTPKDINAYPSHLWVNHICPYFEEQKPKNASRVKIFEDSKWLVVSPLTHEASCSYGIHSNWCVSTSSSQYFRNYTDNAILVFFIDKEGKNPKKPNANDYKVAVNIKLDKPNEINWEWYSMEDNRIDAAFMMNIMPKHLISATEKYVKEILKELDKHSAVDEEMLTANSENWFKTNNNTTYYVLPKYDTIENMNESVRFLTKYNRDEEIDLKHQIKNYFPFITLSVKTGRKPTLNIGSFSWNNLLNMREPNGNILLSRIIDDLPDRWSVFRFLENQSMDVKMKWVDSVMNIFNQANISKNENVPTDRLQVGDVIMLPPTGRRYGNKTPVRVERVAEKSILLSNGKRIVRSSSSYKEKQMTVSKIIDNTNDEPNVNPTTESRWIKTRII